MPPKAFLRSGTSPRWLEALSEQMAVPTQGQGSMSCSVRLPECGSPLGSHACPPRLPPGALRTRLSLQVVCLLGSRLTSPSLTRAPRSGRGILLLAGKKVAPTLAWLTQGSRGLSKAALTKKLEGSEGGVQPQRKGAGRSCEMNGRDQGVGTRGPSRQESPLSSPAPPRTCKEAVTVPRVGTQVYTYCQLRSLRLHLWERGSQCGGQRSKDPGHLLPPQAWGSRAGEQETSSHRRFRTLTVQGLGHVSLWP